MAPWVCAWGSGAWPSGAGTTVPGCGREAGAGALVRAVGAVGHGGSGVLEHAVSSSAASRAEAFQPGGGCMPPDGCESAVLRDARRRREKGVFMGSAVDAPKGPCYGDVTCPSDLPCVAVHSVAKPAWGQLNRLFLEGLKALAKLRSPRAPRHAAPAAFNFQRLKEPREPPPGPRPPLPRPPPAPPP
jgi:hypothetical protein